MHLALQLPIQALRLVHGKMQASILFLWFFYHKQLLISHCVSPSFHDREVLARFLRFLFLILQALPDAITEMYEPMMFFSSFFSDAYAWQGEFGRKID